MWRGCHINHFSSKEDSLIEKSIISGVITYFGIHDIYPFFDLEGEIIEGEIKMKMQPINTTLSFSEYTLYIQKYFNRGISIDSLLSYFEVGDTIKIPTVRKSEEGRYNLILQIPQGRPIGSYTTDEILKYNPH